MDVLELHFCLTEKKMVQVWEMKTPSSHLLFFAICPYYDAMNLYKVAGSSRLVISFRLQVVVGWLCFKVISLVSMKSKVKEPKLHTSTK